MSPVGPDSAWPRRAAFASFGLGVALLAGCRPAVGTARAGPVAPAIAEPPTPQSPPVVLDAASRPAASACDGGHVSALRFVPTTASTLMGIDAGAAVHHPQYVSRRGTIETGEVGRWVLAASECGLGREHWRTATLAADAVGSSTSVGVVRVAGIGSRDRLQCLADRLAVGGKPPFEITQAAGEVELRFGDGGRGWIADDCTLVLASAGAVELTRPRLDRTEDTVLSGPMGNVVARAGEHHLAWLASRTPGTGPLGGMVDAAVGVELRGGFAVNATLQFADPQSAAAAAAQVEQLFSSAFAAGMGVPPRVIDTKSITASDRFMMFQLRGDDGDLSAIIDAMAKNMASVG